MNCMKCGQELQPGESFCESCLAEMEKYPIQTNTVVLLPRRGASTAFKKSHQRRHTPEEQLAALEKRCRRLGAALMVTLLLLISSLAMLGVAVYEWDMQRFLGQNYHSAEVPSATAQSE